MRWQWRKAKSLGLIAFGLAVLSSFTVPAAAQQKAQTSNMELVGYNDLQGRNAYIPTIQKQGDRWIAYVGHHTDKPWRMNPLTGKEEPNGTSIVDVTDPRHPKYLFHIPGDAGDARPGEVAGGTGAAFARTCSGSELPHGEKGTFYLLRAFGGLSWEMWDVTDPSKPSRLNVVLDRLTNTHNGWWECDTGIAYLGGGPLDWVSHPMGKDRHDAISHTSIYDLSDPKKPVFIRSFGLPGQEKGSSEPQPLSGLHGIVSTGPKGNRVYFSNGDAQDGILEIVDREKLLNGPKEPTDANLQYPVVGKIELPPDMGTDMSFPLLHVQLPEFAKQKEGFLKDFLAVIGEGHADLYECQDSRQMMRIFDITTESKPVGVATWTVPEESGHFCSGGYFNTHSSNENFTPIYYNRILFIAHHNAGARAVDIRDPYHPKEIGYYIPAANSMTTCVGKPGQPCKIAVDTNNLDVDDRGYIYLVDAHDTGMHIVQLTGSARQLADFSKADGAAAKH
jgi:hypothetical protein